MNILLYVTTLLTLLALLTFAKIESYRSSAIAQAQFLRYMEVVERQPVNEGFEEQYKRKEGKGAGPSEPRQAGSSKFSIASFLDDEATAELLVKLISNLYGERRFFKEAERKQPELATALVEAMREAGKNRPSFSFKGRVESLADLDLEDLLLHEVRYKILKGSVSVPKLGEYATAVKGPVRLFLAPPSVLALFFDEGTVNAVLEMRRELYRDVESGRMTPEEAASRFRERFEGSALPGIPPSLLSYAVSKTRPKPQ